MKNSQSITTHIKIQSSRFDRLDSVVVLLHGYGDSADNFAQIGEYIASVVPNRIIVIPNAIIDMSYGYAWFHIPDLNNFDVKSAGDRIANLDNALKQYLDHIVIEYNCKSIEMIGFSQGAMLALRSIYLNKHVNKVLAASGIFFNKNHTSISANNVKVLLTHGRLDNVVPFKYASIAEDELQALNVDVSLISGAYSHGIDGIIDNVKQFLQDNTNA